MLRLSVIAALLAFITPLSAASNSKADHYQLLYGSIVNYKVHGSSDGFWSTTGGFDLRLIEETPERNRYSIENLQINADFAHKFAGQGTLEVSPGDKPKISLSISNIVESPTTPAMVFTNVAIAPDRNFPMIAVRAGQFVLGDSAYTIDIRAAPFHDIWISSAADFTANAFPSPTNSIRSGDLLSVFGRIVQRNADLLASLPPTSSDRGLDAVSFHPAGGLAISIDGASDLSDGDILLTHSGQKIRYTDIFTNAVSTQMADPGIDGLQFITETSFYFSVKRDTTYSPSTGQTLLLRDGEIWRTDLQTHELVRVRSREQIFANPEYQPWLVDPAVGVDAFYIWPSGEVWFSLRSSWTAHTAIYSSDGYGIFTDVFAFQHFDPSIDPGLDAFLVITDLAERPSTQIFLQPPTITNNSLRLDWSGPAGAFQIESSPTVAGPFTPAAPIIPNVRFSIPVTNNPNDFYRVRVW